MIKDDGTFMVWSDGGRSTVKPLNWIAIPCVHYQLNLSALFDPYPFAFARCTCTRTNINAQEWYPNRSYGYLEIAATHSL